MGRPSWESDGAPANLNCSPLKVAGNPFPSSHGVSAHSREPRSVGSPRPFPCAPPTAALPAPSPRAAPPEHKGEARGRRTGAGRGAEAATPRAGSRLPSGRLQGQPPPPPFFQGSRQADCRGPAAVVSGVCPRWPLRPPLPPCSFRLTEPRTRAEEEREMSRGAGGAVKSASEAESSPPTPPPSFAGSPA